MDKLVINQKTDSEVLVLGISGELDASSSLKLDEVIREGIEQGLVKIMVDCKDLIYISSAGLGVFVSHIEELKNLNGRFSFFQMNENVYDIFKILGLHRILFIAETEEEAKEYLDES